MPSTKRWLERLQRDPVPWLLDPGNPSARLLTLRHIFRKPEIALLAEQDRLLAWAPIRELRSHWEGYHFWARRDNPYYGSALGNFGTLYLLTQLGAPPFPEVEAACENLLDRGRRSDGGFSPETLEHGPWLCYTGMALQILWHFGFGEDLRARSAWHALRQAIVLRPALLDCPIASGPCYDGLVKALLALLSIPADQRTADDAQAINILCERLTSAIYELLHIGSSWLQPTFPRYYQSDVVELCRALAQSSYRQHHRFHTLLDYMVDLQTVEGRWRKMQATPVLSEERIYHPSRWLTFEAVHTLILTYGDDIYAPSRSTPEIPTP